MLRLLFVFFWSAIAASPVVFAQQPKAIQPAQQMSLAYLQLTDAEITGKSIAKLANRDWGTVRLAILTHMPRLRKLDLSRHPQWSIKQQLTNACLSSICQLTELETLTLSGDITDAAFDQLATLPKLKSLSILMTGITGHGFDALKDSMLENLLVSPSQIDDQALRQLKKCHTLKQIMVIGQMSGSEANLIKAHPELGLSFVDP